MNILHFSIMIIGILMIFLPITVAFGQSQQNASSNIPPMPDKIGCYNYTKDTGWQSTPCANTSPSVSMGPPPVQNSSKRYDIKVEFAPVSIAVNSVTNMIYTSHTSLGDSVSVISGKTNKTVSVIKVGTDPVHVAVNPITNMIYVANSNSHSVSVNPDTNMVYVANDFNSSSNKLSVIDGQTNKLVAKVSIGSGAQNIAIDSPHAIIYVANYASNSISAISGKTNTLIDTIPVGALPTSIAINSITGTVYVANWRSDFVSMIPFSNLDLQTIPEFPFAVPVMLIGIVSAIGFYRIGFEK